MILLDTCALLWLVMEPERLSARAKALISTHRASLAVFTRPNGAEYRPSQNA